MTKEKTELKVNTFKFSTAPAEEDTTAAEIGEDLFFGMKKKEYRKTVSSLFN